MTFLSRPGWPGWVVAALLLVLGGTAVFGDSGLLALRRLRGEVGALHREVRALEVENDRLSKAIADLQENPAVIERIAREELGLVRPGERVLRFPRTGRPGAPGSSGSPAPRAP